ncbi:unnamed protein product, partial [Musa banksii]
VPFRDSRLFSWVESMRGRAGDDGNLFNFKQRKRSGRNRSGQHQTSTTSAP